jgi:hypothetical protein
MKYIIFRDRKLNREIPILFPNTLVHLDVALALSKVVGTSIVVAAGEFSSLAIDSEAFYGQSTSIGIKSRAIDGDFISGLDYNHGVF